MMIRSFLAFELTPEAKDALSRLAEEMKTFRLDVRWVPVENVHLTLVFLGAVSPDTIDAVGEEAGEACREFGPFEVFLKGSGVFPGPRRPNVLWVGLEGDIERMASLRDALQERLLPFGVKEEKRRFKPHLTLARFRKFENGGKGLEELLTRFREWSGPTCRLTDLILFRSDLKPGGAVYSRLKSWPLTGVK